MKIPNFTPDQIAKWTKEEINRVRERALKQTANDLVVLCDAELEKRKPPKKLKSEQTRIGRAG